MKNIFAEPDFGKLSLAVAFFIPVFALCFFAITPSKRIIPDRKNENHLEMPQDAILNIPMRDWRSSSWERKEQLVNGAILYFRREQNSVISKSAGYYVEAIEDFLQQDPTAESKDLFMVLSVLAVVEYDFYNGQDADAQAMRILGPQVFEQNRKQKIEMAEAYQKAKLDF